MTNISRKPSDLRDVLYEFSLSKDTPDADTLDQFVRRYPEHADSLTSFAVALVNDSLFPDEAEPIMSARTVSPAVSRAMSKFLNAVHGNQVKQQSSPAHAALSEGTVLNPFTKLDRNGFRAVADKMHSNVVFLCKLRDRQIDVATMSAGFLQFAGQSLGIAAEQLIVFLSGETQTPTPQFYKADKKPETQQKQSFEEAVRSSSLSDEQQQFLLKL